LQKITKPAHEQLPRLKRGRPVGAKDSQPRQRKAPKEPTSGTPVPTPTVHEVQTTPNTMQTPENKEIFIHYINTGTIWHRPYVRLDDQFVSFISQTIIDTPAEPKTIQQARDNPDWLEWEKEINFNLDSLIKRQVFEPIVLSVHHPTPIQQVINALFLKRKMLRAKS
jgi:hypothetical protein